MNGIIFTKQLFTNKARHWHKALMIILLTLIGALLVGCSSNGVSSVETEPALPPAISPSGNAIASYNDAVTTEENSPVQLDGWFFGAINDNLKIHLKLNVAGDQVSGVYYYDKYKTDIKLNGFLIDRSFTVSEEGSKGEISAVIVSNDLIQGVWTDRNKIYPLYLIKEGSNISPPEKPHSSLLEWSGEWNGTNTGNFSGSRLSVKPVFNNLIHFNLFAYNGTHNGDVSGLALVSGNTAIYYGDPLLDLGKEVFFKFSLNKNDRISVDSNDYTYGCGAGVSFDKEYTKKPLKIKTLTAIELGLVDTDEQEKVFKTLTGEYYKTFLQYAQIVYDEKDEDNMGAAVRTLGIRGYTNAGIIMFKDNTFWAAIEDGSGIQYFSNDKKGDVIPETIVKWNDPSSGLKWTKTIK